MIRSLLVLAMLLLAAPALANDEAEHDRARRAVEAGEIRPLRDILTAAEKAYGGRFIAAELERHDGRWVYEIKLITADGRVAKLYYDAGSGALLRARIKGGRP